MASAELFAQWPCFF